MMEQVNCPLGDLVLSDLYDGNFVGFVADVGGGLGLCLGASLLAVIEFVDFIIQCIVAYCNIGCQGKSSGRDNLQ